MAESNFKVKEIYFYKDEPVLVFYDFMRLMKNFYLVYFKNENIKSRYVRNETTKG